MFMN